MSSILITGGAGFIGTNAALHFQEKGWKISIYDNLSRGKLFNKPKAFSRNWEYLAKKEKEIELIEADILDFDALLSAIQGKDAVLHAAGQTAVTSSFLNPRTDFEINTYGTFNVLEACRLSECKPALIFCSTNKVYGEKVNELSIYEGESRYSFSEKSQKQGIPESFGIDLCGHTPYGCSKLSGDLYVQEYARTYDLKTGVFRMSCIYGPWQFGIADQGWVAWFAKAILQDKELCFYGNGKQVRDILYVSDLIKVYEMFLKSNLSGEVWNIGGGAKNTISLLELIEKLEKLIGKSARISFSTPRSGDQKIFFCDIKKSEAELRWKPLVSIDEGLTKLVNWIKSDIDQN